ncbi:MAG TPA: YfdX family protein [Candidatus Angelobacter sp.]|nr:YfdX family protein [Candidatus Angelobacter sp.]
MAQSTTSSRSDNQVATSSTVGTGSYSQTALEEQRKRADQQMRPEVEEQRRKAQEEAEQSLDQEAIAAVDLTERAMMAISENRIDEALSAIEQATGKINVLLNRNPATALIPVNLQVSVIDTAPESIGDIAILTDAASVAIEINDLPGARALLDSVRSEIRVRTYNLPLASYPSALQQAARLVDQKKAREAGAVLLVALNTLAIVDQVVPLPLLLAREAVNAAQQRSQTDREAAQQLLELADHELERTLALGYTAADEDYRTLRDTIKSLRKQLKSNEDTGSFFSSLKEKLASLLRRRSEKRIQSDGKQQPSKAA